MGRCQHNRITTMLGARPVRIPGPGDRKSYGGHSERETPGPIPNPEVKPFSADGTARGTVWETRTSPDYNTSRLVTFV